MSVVVIGAGQAGLSAAYHLKRAGIDIAVLDANPAPGGAWQHRWESLTVAKLNGIFDLPGMPRPEMDPNAPSRDAVPRYFAAFEQRNEVGVRRPVRVTAVEYADDDEAGDLVVTTDSGSWRTRAVVNATGTWENPLRPEYPGAHTFRGRQLHTHEYTRLEDFRGQRVAIVGGGISGVQLLEEISRVAHTRWYTRREPVFIEGEFMPETNGRDTIARVTADVEAGLIGQGEEPGGREALTAELTSAGVEWTTWQGWEALDAFERELGASDAFPRERVKVVSREAMTAISKGEEPGPLH